jgi:DnaD and phage-associated domain
MAWIQSNEELATHPKTKRAARALGISLPTLTGHLHFLWWWCLKYAQDGDLSQFDSQDIADAASWEGDPDQFVTALLECGPGDSFGFLEKADDGSLSVHDWLDYAGRLIDKRVANAERMRASRAKKARAKCVQSTCNECAGARVEESIEEKSRVSNTTTNNAREEVSEDVNEAEETVPEIGQIENELPESVNEMSELITMDTGTKAVDWAQRKWGRPISPGESEAIISWCDEFSSRGSPAPDDLVIEALKQCDSAGVRNMQYLRAVLTDWRDNGILIVEHVLARDAERQKNHKSKNKDPGDKPPKRTRTDKYEKFYL